jgi:hypothetical protein
MESFNAGVRLVLLKFKPEAQKSIPIAWLFVFTNHKLSDKPLTSVLLFIIAFKVLIKNDYNQISHDKQE